MRSMSTEPVHARIDSSIHERAASRALMLDDLGRTETFYVDLERYVGEVPASPRLSMLARTSRHLKLNVRSMPAMLGIRNACAGFRNFEDAPPAATT